MTSKMTRDEARAAMRRIGVDDRAIDRALEKEYPTEGALALSPAVRATLPVRIVVPWSALCSDNERSTPSLKMVKEKPVPRKVMTARYKAARDKIKAAAIRAMAGAAPLDEPLSLVARVYTPTQRRADVVNFAKGVHDALSRIVYTDDKWLRDVRWVDAGLDMDAPRAEIEINSLAKSL